MPRKEKIGDLRGVTGERLSHFRERENKTTPAAKPEEKQPDADTTTEEVSRG
jgi:hypothetical protein